VQRHTGLKEPFVSDQSHRDSAIDVVPPPDTSILVPLPAVPTNGAIGLPEVEAAEVVETDVVEPAVE
jgi:hypothetical protein